MRTSVSNPELVELFIRQTQPFAKSSSAHFQGKKLFSYGTVIAQIVGPDSNRTFLLNSTRYSNTTSVLQNLLKESLRPADYSLSVPGIDRWQGGEFADKKRIVKVLKDQRSVRLSDSKKAREPKRTRLLLEAEGLERLIAEVVKTLSRK